MNLVCLSLSHGRTSISDIERIRFESVEDFYRSASKITDIYESLLLQTCTRVEVYAFAQHEKEAVHSLLNLFLGHNDQEGRNLRGKFNVYLRRETAKHLFRLASGLESLAIGEPQILAQVRQALYFARKMGGSGPYIEALFERAVRCGRRARDETKIGQGSISLGKMAVELAERELSSLYGRRVVLLGAGEMGVAIARALAEHKAMVRVVNRTYETGVMLATKVGGIAIRYDQLARELSRADALICATSATHYTVTPEKIKKALRLRRPDFPLLIVDISSPRNVDPSVGKFSNIRLKDLEGLRSMAVVEAERRKAEIPKVEEIIEEEIDRLEDLFKRREVEPFIAEIYRRAEGIRRLELTKASKRLKGIDDGQRRVIDALTYELVERVLNTPVTNLRRAALEGNVATILAAKELFRSTLG